jgi:hypothetical protein
MTPPPTPGRDLERLRVILTLRFEVIEDQQIQEIGREIDERDRSIEEWDREIEERN